MIGGDDFVPGGGAGEDGAAGAGGGGAGGGGGGSGVFDANSSGFFSSTRSSPRSQGSQGGYDASGERFSRKVFVGGLPPDIDEGSCVLLHNVFSLCLSFCYCFYPISQRLCSSISFFFF